MSNRWSQYIEEAKSKSKPFTLEGVPLIDPDSGETEERTLSFDPPSGNGLVRFQQAFRSGDLEAMLWCLAGEHWEDLMAGPFKEPASWRALEDLVYDMIIHFEIGSVWTLVGPAGKEETTRDPRRVKALIDRGWQHKGEAQARTSRS